jgi:kynureninase
MITRAIAEELDRADPLAGFRRRFAIDDGGGYMDGNSLGRPPLGREEQVASARSRLADRSHPRLARMDPRAAPHRRRDRDLRCSKPGRRGHRRRLDLGQSVQGGGRGDRRQARPHDAVTSDDNFPTDLYVLQSLAAQNALRLKVLPADPVHGLDAAVLAEAIGPIRRWSASRTSPTAPVRCSRWPMSRGSRTRPGPWSCGM